MAPFDIVALFGKAGGYFVFFLIGLGFGAVLEMSGFGDSRKLAAQFYFKEMRVLKVMFTAIVVSMVLIFLSSSLGLLDFRSVWINPTYLPSQIVGGLIMGVGFIIGGFCPGTSLVSASTLKIDGLLFFTGVFLGVGIFGETVEYFQHFYESGEKERFLLSDLFGLDIGVTVSLIVLFALTAFYWAEISEKVFGENIPFQKIQFIPQNTRYIAASILLFSIAAFAAFIGQPDAERKWKYVSSKNEPFLSKREVYIHPGELRDLMHNRQIYLRLLDVRPEKDFNLFHLRDAQRVEMSELMSANFADEINKGGSNTVSVLISNTEKDSTHGWKLLKANGLLNVYILEGGINKWLSVFPLPEAVAEKTSEQKEEMLNFTFCKTVGEELISSIPEAPHENHLEHLEYTKKVKLQKKKTAMGGCG